MKKPAKRLEEWLAARLLSVDEQIVMGWFTHGKADITPELVSHKYCKGWYELMYCIICLP